jgi:hypothetical protein
MVISDDDWIGSGGSVEPVHRDQVGVWVGEHHRVGDDELANNVPPGCDNLG